MISGLKTTFQPKIIKFSGVGVTIAETKRYALCDKKVKDPIGKKNTIKCIA